MLRIFIGWDSRFPEPADVLRYSLIKHSLDPARDPLSQARRAAARPGVTIRWPRPNSPTRGSWSRICAIFAARRVFMDNDMLALGDVEAARPVAT